MAFWDVTPCNLANLTFYTLRRVTFQNTVTLIHRNNNPAFHTVSILSINPSLIYVHSSLRFSKSFAAFFNGSTDLMFLMSYRTLLASDVNLVNIQMLFNVPELHPQLFYSKYFV